MKNNVPRITNICYPRGSIIYANFKKDSEYYFLNMRPLIVISLQNQMFDSLNVIACGSRDRPGIEISLFNHMIGKWIGNHQYSVAQPYAIYTILVNQVVEFHGVIESFTMKAIDKAVAFHLGLTDDVPPYMQDIYDEMMAPRYSNGTLNNTQLEDPHQMGSLNETTRKFENLPKKYVGKITGKPYPKPTETFIPMSYARNEVKSEGTTSSVPIKKDLSNNNLQQNEASITVETLKDNTLAQKSQTKTPKSSKSNELKTAGQIASDQNGLTPISSAILNIVASLTEQTKFDIIIRKVSPSSLLNNPVKIYDTQISQIRKGIEYTYIYNEKFAKRMKDRICKRQSNFRFLTDFEKAGCILYCSPDDLGITESIYNEIAKQFIKDHNLQFEDGRCWRGVPMFPKLKNLYLVSCKKR